MIQNKVPHLVYPGCLLPFRAYIRRSASLSNNPSSSIIYHYLEELLVHLFCVISYIFIYIKHLPPLIPPPIHRHPSSRYFYNTFAFHPLSVLYCKSEWNSSNWSNMSLQLALSSATGTLATRYVATHHLYLPSLF